MASIGHDQCTKRRFSFNVIGNGFSLITRTTIFQKHLANNVMYLLSKILMSRLLKCIMLTKIA